MSVFQDFWQALYLPKKRMTFDFQELSFSVLCHYSENSPKSPSNKIHFLDEHG